MKIRSLNGEDIYNKMSNSLSDAIDGWLTSYTFFSSIDDCFDLINVIIDKSKSEESIPIIDELILCALAMYLNNQNLFCNVGEDESGALTITVIAKDDDVTI